MCSCSCKCAIDSYCFRDRSSHYTTNSAECGPRCQARRTVSSSQTEPMAAAGYDSTQHEQQKQASRNDQLSIQNVLRGRSDCALHVATRRIPPFISN